MKSLHFDRKWMGGAISSVHRRKKLLSQGVQHLGLKVLATCLSINMKLTCKVWWKPKRCKGDRALPAATHMRRDMVLKSKQTGTMGNNTNDSACFFRLCYFLSFLSVCALNLIPTIDRLAQTKVHEEYARIGKDNYEKPHSGTITCCALSEIAYQKSHCCCQVVADPVLCRINSNTKRAMLVSFFIRWD